MEKNLYGVKTRFRLERILVEICNFCWAAFNINKKSNFCTGSLPAAMVMYEYKSLCIAVSESEIISDMNLDL